MFDLERALGDWRTGLMAGEAMGGCDLDELEDHLRDGIDARVARGFSEEEAFVVARHDLGSGGSLEVEFGKINRSRTMSRRVLWMIAGYLGISFLISFIALLQSVTFLITNSFGDVQVASWAAIAASPVGYGILVVPVILGLRGRVRVRAPMSRTLRISPGFVLSAGLLAILGLRLLRSLVSMSIVWSAGAADYGQLLVSLQRYNFAMSLLVPIGLCLVLFAGYSRLAGSRSVV